MKAKETSSKAQALTSGQRPEGARSLNAGRLRLAFDNSPIGIAIIGLDSRLQKVNKALCETLGYGEGELLTRKLDEFTHTDDIKRGEELVRKVLRDEIPSYRLEKRFIAKDGRQMWLDLSAVVIRGAKHEPLYWLVTVENITERKRALEALRMSEERYRSFVSNSSEGIWRLEAEHPIDTSLPVDEQIEMFHRSLYLAECNDALARMYGYERANDILGSPISELLIFSDPTHIPSLHAFIGNGYRLQDFEAVEEDSAGLKRCFSSNVIGIVINGQLLRIWGTRVDETERKLAEAEIKRSRRQMRALASRIQSLREKERADIAREMHDVLGQGLTGLKIDLSWLAKRLPEAAEESVSVEMAQRISEATRLVDETIGAVKILSTQLRPGVLDKFGLFAAVEWQCQEFERRTAIKCECRLADEEVNLEAERSTALFRILQEALANVSRHAEAEEVIVELKVNDEMLMLTVTDDGRGIRASEIDKPESLGLLGMRERAELQGGTFTVEGEHGRGTSVRAQMPLGEIAQQ